MLILNRLANLKSSRYVALTCNRLASHTANDAPAESIQTKTNEKREFKQFKPKIPANYRFVYPEFLPDPRLQYRNPIREKLERIDMLRRRSHCDFPEFYVGTIMAVTTADPQSPGKTSRFLGICIERAGSGLRTEFILRNVIDHEGMEVRYKMYDPTIIQVDVIRLEKRLDDKLLYLRDALPEYSTFDLNMEPELHPEGMPVPINAIQVKLKPRPWKERYERQNLKGVSNVMQLITPKMVGQIKKSQKPWEKYDLMKEYRKTIPAEEQDAIYGEIQPKLSSYELLRKRKERQQLLKKSK